MPYIDLQKMRNHFALEGKPFPTPSKEMPCPKCGKTQPAHNPRRDKYGRKTFCLVCGWEPGSRNKVAASTKQKVFETDNFECVYCGQKENLTLDHIIPHSHGGGNRDTNLLTACKSCNSKRHNAVQPTALFGRFRGNHDN